MHASTDDPSDPGSHQTPDRVTELVTGMVELVSELYEHPADGAPHDVDADLRLRAAIARLERLAGHAQVAPPADAPSPASGDRGEWVEAGWL